MSTQAHQPLLLFGCKDVFLDETEYRENVIGTWIQTKKEGSSCSEDNTLSKLSFYLNNDFRIIRIRDNKEIFSIIWAYRFTLNNQYIVVKPNSSKEDLPRLNITQMTKTKFIQNREGKDCMVRSEFVGDCFI